MHCKGLERPVLDDARDGPSSQLDESIMRLRVPTNCAIAMAVLTLLRMFIKMLAFLYVYETKTRKLENSSSLKQLLTLVHGNHRTVILEERQPC
jgi:hypothetical protein